MHQFCGLNKDTYPKCRKPYFYYKHDRDDVWLLIALPTHVTNKSVAVTHDFFSIIAGRRHQPSLNMCKMLYEHKQRLAPLNSYTRNFFSGALRVTHFRNVIFLKNITNLSLILPRCGNPSHKFS